MTVEFHLKSTYGDPYYIGLNEIEIFNIFGKNVLNPKNGQDYRIHGLPPGVFVDTEMIMDKRVVKNLVGGQGVSNRYKNIWLTFFVKYPLKVLNYSKNIIAIEF